VSQEEQEDQTKVMSNPTPPQPVTIYWIDVRDHLPDDEITVLVSSGDQDIDVGYHLAGEWYRTYGQLLGDVAYWADLPEPPKR
jgi:hypothetical protein